MIPGSANSLLLASAAGTGEYTVSRSVRFNSSDSAYLSRTPSTNGNRRTWTFSFWTKRGLGEKALLSVNSTSDSKHVLFRFESDDTLTFYVGYLTSYGCRTTQVFRDPSAWYHIVLAFDATASGSAKVKIYVNGIEVTTFSSDTRSSIANQDWGVNEASILHVIGRNGTSAATYFSGYLADVHLVDGQALTPSSFTEVSATTGQLIPKAYTGTYGTNGFHLPFSDNSTAAALGTDTSGNSNTWAVNNISVAAGAGNDSLVDTPTNGSQTDTGVGGEVVGNYATWNPLDHAGIAFANGNLDISDINAGSYNIVRGTVAVSSGKWYWEVAMGNLSSNAVRVGVLSPSSTISTSTALPLTGPDGWGLGSATSGSTFASGNTIGLALDLDAGTLEFYKNGSLMATSRSGISGTYAPAISLFTYETSGTFVTNFGQRPFAYTAPSGFKALCTANLPSTTITTSGSYTGNGVAGGPFVYLNGVPTAMTVNGNAVTFGTHADKLSNGFKIRTTSTTYNQNASTYNYSITSTGDPFKTARAQSNP